MNYHLILFGEFDELGELGELNEMNPQFPMMNYPLVGNWANQTAEGNIWARKKRKKVKKKTREKNIQILTKNMLINETHDFFNKSTPNILHQWDGCQ